MGNTAPGSDQLDGDLHSVTDDEFFEQLDEAKKIPIYDENGNEVNVFGDVIDAREQKAAADAAGVSWKPEDFLPGSAQ